MTDARQHSTPGFFLTLEGGEGVGKSTAIETITAYLTAQQRAYVVTREPGGTVIAERIRELMLQPQTDSDTLVPDAELLLAFAARAQHLATVIRPALQAGKVVVCDRFTDATFAYQGAGRQLATEPIEYLANWLHGDCWPQLTLLFDAPVTTAQQRIRARGQLDRIEQEQLDFFERVHTCYRQRAQVESQRFQIVDATLDLAAVQQMVTTIISDVL